MATHFEMLRLRAKAMKSSSNLQAAAAKAAFTFENDTYNWLTYESIYNNDDFTHTDAKRSMGIYNMPLDNLRIIIATDLADVDGHLNFLKDLFFLPSTTLTNDLLRKLLYCPWDHETKDYDEHWKRSFSQEVEKLRQNATAIPRVRFPYNVVNNDAGSPCIGTQQNHAPDTAIQIENKAWDMWQTASRSCFVKLQSSTAQDGTGSSIPTAQGQWTYGIRSELGDAKYSILKENLVPTNANKPSDTAFKHFQREKSKNVLDPYVFSVKTGVRFVGKTKQEQTKGRLEPDSIVATLRSEFMQAMNRYYEARGKESKIVKVREENLLILPELLTVTYQASTSQQAPSAAKNQLNLDGFQVRDLRGLDPNMFYFPALSTPYVKGGNNFRSYACQQDLGKDDFQAWKDYWRPNFAGRIGKTKALLHLLYGFAPQTPNMQNFVFELDMTTAASPAFKRTVLRDVLDYRLHTSWIRVALSTESDYEKALEDSLTQQFEVDQRLPLRIRNIFLYEASLMSPVFENKLLLASSEAGVYAPLTWDPQNPTARQNDIEIVEKVQNNNEKKKVEQIKAANGKLGEILDGGKINYYSGIQLNFFLYSAPVRGDTLNTNAKEWRRAYAAMPEWGLDHAWQFVNTVNETLSVQLEHNGTVITRNYLRDLEFNECIGAIALKPCSGRPLTSLNRLTTRIENINLLDKTDTAGGSLQEVHNNLCTWDFYVSGIIERAIYQNKGVVKILRKFLRG